MPADPVSSTASHGARTDDGPRRDGDRPQGSGRRLASLGDLTALLQGLTLLAALGFGLGLLLWSLAFVDGDGLVTFVRGNTLAAHDRRTQLLVLLGGTAVAVLAGARAAWRTTGDRGVALRQLAGRLAPLAVVGVVPLLFSWRCWEGRAITFGVLLLVSGLVLHQLLHLRAAEAALPWEARLSRHRLVRGIAHALSPPAAGEVRPWRAAFVVVAVAAAAYAIYFAALTVAAHWNLQSKSFDMAIEDNVLWNLVHGSTPLFKATPLRGPDVSHFGHHATIFAYAIAPFYVLAQRAETLLVVQAMLVGVAAIPLFLFGARHIGPWPAAVLAIGYLLYPPVHSATLYDFHYLTLAPVFVWTVWWLLDTRRDRLAVVAVLVTLSIREDVAASLAVVGVVFALFGGRPAAGLLLSAVALGYFVVMKFGLMPLAKGNRQSFLYMFEDLLPEGETGYGGVLKTAIGNPGFTLQTLVTAEKVDYLLRIFAPLTLLPLRRPFALVLLLPGLLFSLFATGYAPLIETSYHYATHFTLAMFPAAVLQLRWLAGDSEAGHVRSAQTFRHALIVFALCMLAGSVQHGIVVQRNTARAGPRAFTAFTTDADLARRAALKELLVHLPPDASVAASKQLIAQVSNREDAFPLRFGTYHAAFVLIEPKALAKNERAKLLEALDKGRYGIVADEAPFLLLARDADPGTALTLRDDLRRRTRTAGPAATPQPEPEVGTSGADSAD